MYQLTEKQLKELEVRFTYHAPQGTQPTRYQLIRDGARVYAQLLMESCPESRELALALTALENAVMWANASIARNEQND
jgi:hypothetical protein